MTRQDILEADEKRLREIAAWLGPLERWHGYEAYHAHGTTYCSLTCVRCGAPYLERTHPTCPNPSPLTGPIEVLAFQWRDLCMREGRGDKWMTELDEITGVRAWTSMLKKSTAKQQFRAAVLTLWEATP